MAHRVVWLPAAADDLEAIASYISSNSPSYAAGMVRKVLTAAEMLAEFPRMGRQVPEWDDEIIRERIIYPYRMIYRVETKQVVVLAVIHGARLLPDQLRDRDW